MSTLLGNLRVGVDYAAFEAKKQARLLGGQNKLKKLRTQEQAQFSALGQETWSLFHAGQPLDSKLQERCAQIQDTMQQIADLEAQIEAIRQEQPPEPILCTQCGRELGLEDAFCSGCGAAGPQIASMPPTPTPQIVCPTCGREVRNNAKFCSGCGQQISGLDNH